MAGSGDWAELGLEIERFAHRGREVLRYRGLGTAIGLEIAGRIGEV